MDVREFKGEPFTIYLVSKSIIEEGKCKYEIHTNMVFSPNIIYYDKCGKWQVGDKVHFVKD